MKNFMYLVFIRANFAIEGGACAGCRAAWRVAWQMSDLSATLAHCLEITVRQHEAQVPFTRLL